MALGNATFGTLGRTSSMLLRGAGMCILPMPVRANRLVSRAASAGVDRYPYIEHACALSC